MKLVFVDTGKIFKRKITMSWREYITSNPSVCHGKVCIKDTRIQVSVILDNFVADVTPDEILKSYPSLNRQAISASFRFERVCF